MKCRCCEVLRRDMRPLLCSSFSEIAFDLHINRCSVELKYRRNCLLLDNKGLSSCTRTLCLIPYPYLRQRTLKYSEANY